jgi:hypothetical protein
VIFNECKSDWHFIQISSEDSEILISGASESVCALSHIATRATVLVKSLISNQSPAMTGLLEHVYLQEGSNSRLYTYNFYYKLCPDFQELFGPSSCIVYCIMYPFSFTSLISDLLPIFFCQVLLTL